MTTTNNGTENNAVVAKQKWFEIENSFPYAVGEQLVVVAGPSLIGRRVLVEKPSAKKEALKCYLVNPKTGEKQGTLITMDFAKLRKLTEEEASQPYPAPVVEPVAKTEEAEAV